MSSTAQQLANLKKAVEAGTCTPAEARDQQIAIRLLAVSDARRAREINK